MAVLLPNHGAGKDRVRFSDRVRSDRIGNNRPVDGAIVQTGAVRGPGSGDTPPASPPYISVEFSIDPPLT